MVHFKFIVIVFAFFLSTNAAFAQLPEEWYGFYKGQLEITNFKGEVSEVYMELFIERNTDSTYIFDITYGEDSTRQVRHYELIHDKGNQYVMDEKNGVVLPLMLFKKRLVSSFMVQENLLHVSYSLQNKKLIFRTTSSRESIKTGGRNQVPQVQGYLPFVDQYAVLKRSKRR